MASILAASTADSDYSAAKKIRDQAFTFLKMAVDEICECGQYVFRKDPGRKRGYSSSYIRRIRKKRIKSNTDEDDS